MDKETLQGIAKYLSLVVDSLVYRTNLTQNTAQIIQRFNNGELAFILNTAEIAMLIRIPSVNGGLQGSRISNDGIVVLPVPQGSNGGVSFIGGSNLSIPANYPNKKEAIELLMFLTSDSSIDAYTKTIGFLPPIQSALKSWETDSVYKSLVDCLNNGKAYTSIPKWWEVENILASLFSDIWSVLEFEDLYSEKRIYSILLKYHIEINKLLGYEEDSPKFDYFSQIWRNALPVKKQVVENTENSSDNALLFSKKFSLGLFLTMMLFGFVFTYRKKR